MKVPRPGQPPGHGHRHPHAHGAGQGIIVLLVVMVVIDMLAVLYFGTMPPHAPPREARGLGFGSAGAWRPRGLAPGAVAQLASHLAVTW